MTRTLRWLPAVLGLALLASCGSHDTEEYEEKLKGVGKQILADLEAIRLDIAYAHDFDPDAAPPEGWLSNEYVAGASARVDVDRYFRGYLAYVGEIESRFEALMDSVADVRLAEANLGDDAEEIAVRFKRGMARSSESRRQLSEAMRHYAESALKLHEFLTRTDARILPGDDGVTPTFDDSKELMEYNTLYRTVTYAERQLESQQERALAAATGQRRPARGR